MKIGFIGFGNMAKAIAGGIVKKGLLPACEIAVFDIMPQALEDAKAQGMTILDSERQIALQSDFIFLCVKPQSFTDVLMKIKNDVSTKNVFLSIAAGITMASIEKILGDVPLVRAMPNTPLLLGCGAVALTANSHIVPTDFQFVKAVFKSVGSVYELPENKFNEVINVNGSTPAYIYLFAKTITDYANKSGIPYEIALAMFCDTLKGSAEMLTASGKSADELIEMVSSKGGTTVAALDTFAKTGFVESLEAGMKACVNRAYEMSL